MHVWRIHAYNMGMEDQANLVKDSYEETIELLEPYLKLENRDG